MMAQKDFYNSIIDDVFSSPKPIKRKSRKRTIKRPTPDFYNSMFYSITSPKLIKRKSRKRTIKRPTPDFYNSMFYSITSPKLIKRKSRKRRSSSTNDYDGISNAYGSIKNIYSMTKRMHQKTKKVPTDNDEILARAKSIRAKEAMTKKIKKDRDYIILHNEKLERQRKHKIYAKHGYVEGNKMIQQKIDSAKKSKLNKLRRLIGK